MHCERIQQSFLDYQRGLLAPSDANEVRTHLNRCLECQRQWSGLQETLTKLDRLLLTQPPIPSDGGAVL